MPLSNVKFTFILQDQTVLCDADGKEAEDRLRLLLPDIYPLYIEVAGDMIRKNDFLEIICRQRDASVSFNKERVHGFEEEDFFIEAHRRTSDTDID